MKHLKPVLSSAAAALALGATLLVTGAAHPARTAPLGGEVQLSITKIYWEYNASANDLGVHVSLDGEDWKNLEIRNPAGHAIFVVKGRGPYQEFGMLTRSVFFGPMAVAIMGGLAVATVLTVLFLPALYAAWFRVKMPAKVST